MQCGCVCDIEIAYENDLWDCVASQLDVPVGNMRKAERNYIANPLDLMDDSISVGQVCTIFHGQLSGLPNHTVYLSLDLFCETGGERTELETAFHQQAATEQLKDS